MRCCISEISFLPPIYVRRRSAIVLRDDVDVLVAEKSTLSQ